MLAPGALFECARRRITVPGRLAVMGFADLPVAASIEPSLTTVKVRATEMGQRAGSLLMQRLAGEGSTQRIVDLGFAIAARAGGPGR